MLRRNDFFINLPPQSKINERHITLCRLKIQRALIKRVKSQGHAGRTAADNYGDVTLKTKIDAIDRLPGYSVMV